LISRELCDALTYPTILFWTNLSETDPTVSGRPNYLAGSSFPSSLLIVIVRFLLCPTQLEQKQIPPPYRPRLESENDLTNFPPEFTDEPVELTPDDQ
jgi:hypothetical protein